MLSFICLFIIFNLFKLIKENMMFAMQAREKLTVPLSKQTKAFIQVLEAKDEYKNRKKGLQTITTWNYL